MSLLCQDKTDAKRHYRVIRCRHAAKEVMISPWFVGFSVNLIKFFIGKQSVDFRMMCIRQCRKLPDMFSYGERCYRKIPMQDIYQGSVATRLRCGGIFNYQCAANLPLSMSVKEF